MAKLINKTLQTTIDNILKKVIIPTKIFKAQIDEYFTIEIETTEPTKFESVLYKSEADRDADWNVFDNEVFITLSFNPNLFNVLNLENPN